MEEVLLLQTLRLIPDCESEQVAIDMLRQSVNGMSCEDILRIAKEEYSNLLARMKVKKNRDAQDLLEEIASVIYLEEPYESDEDDDDDEEEDDDDEDEDDEPPPPPSKKRQYQGPIVQLDDSTFDDMARKSIRALRPVYSHLDQTQSCSSASERPVHLGKERRYTV